MSIAPKKANWDLRRDISKKLEKLERRTQRALIDLMRMFLSFQVFELQVGGKINFEGKH